MFGKCNNPYGHGHNYDLHVTVAGDPARASGMVVERDAIDRLVRDAVMPRIDRKDMNAAVPEFADLTPTTENLAQVIGQWLGEVTRIPQRLVVRQALFLEQVQVELDVVADRPVQLATMLLAPPERRARQDQLAKRSTGSRFGHKCTRRR